MNYNDWGAALRAAPEDDDLWRVWADFLQEQGHDTPAARARWFAGLRRVLRNAHQGAVPLGPYDRRRLQPPGSEYHRILGTAPRWATRAAAVQMFDHLRAPDPPTWGRGYEGFFKWPDLLEDARHTALMHAMGLRPDTDLHEKREVLGRTAKKLWSVVNNNVLRPYTDPDDVHIDQHKIDLMNGAGGLLSWYPIGGMQQAAARRPTNWDPDPVDTTASHTNMLRALESYLSENPPLPDKEPPPPDPNYHPPTGHMSEGGPPPRPRQYARPGRYADPSIAAPPDEPGPLIAPLEIVEVDRPVYPPGELGAPRTQPNPPPAPPRNGPQDPAGSAGRPPAVGAPPVAAPARPAGSRPAAALNWATHEDFGASLADAMAAAGRDPEDAALRGEAAMMVASRLPPSVYTRLADGRISEFYAHDTPEACTEAWNAYDGVNEDPAVTGYYVGGFYDNKTGRMEINGVDPPGTLAHELGHAIDVSGLGGYWQLSRTDEFRRAWRAEIAGGDFLSEYAATDEVEGFAEVCRLLYGTEDGEIVLRRGFPLVHAVFRNFGLV